MNDYTFFHRIYLKTLERLQEASINPFVDYIKLWKKLNHVNVTIKILIFIFLFIIWFPKLFY